MILPEILRFTIKSFPMSVNKMFVTNRYGRRFLSQDAKDFKKDFYFQYHQLWADKIMMNDLDYIIISMDFYDNWKTKKGEPKKKDLDNLIKNTLDAFSEASGIDDKYVQSLSASKFDLLEGQEPSIFFEVRIVRK